MIEKRRAVKAADGKRNPVKSGSIYTCRTSSRKEANKVLQGKELLRGSRKP